MVIHRFMAAHSTIGSTAMDGHLAPEIRLDSTVQKRMRHTSEQSEAYSEASESAGGGGGSGPGGIGRLPFGGSFGGFQYPVPRRKGPIRSMTEVRPSITNDTFLMMDTTRALRESREPSPLSRGETGGSKRSSIVEENDNLLISEVSYCQ